MVGRLLALLIAAALAAPALAAGPELSTPPPASPPAAPETRSGVLTLAGGAFAYLPKGRDATAPAPLLVYFVGAGGQPRDVLTAYRDHADREGFVLLIPSPKGATWDMIDDLSRRFGIEMNVTPRYGKDIKALEASLADLFGKVAIDPKRIAVMGFSNGATYALSVGTANPQLFSAVLAMSPGPAFPTKFDPAQRVFISHGESDDVLPFSYTRGVVAKLRVRKMQVDFMPFKGKHEIPAEARTRALETFLGRPLKG